MAVAATESAKIQATIQGISLAVTGSVLGKEVDAFGVDVQMQSLDDPESERNELVSSHATLMFARNKAHAAFIEYEKLRGSPPLFSVAFETGLDRLVDGTHDFFTWVVIYNGKNFGSSRTQSFCLPPSILAHLQNTSMQKKDAERIIFGTLACLPLTNPSPLTSAATSPRSPARSAILNDTRTTGRDPATPLGAIAHLLHGKMTWSRYLEPSVVLAFLPFQWRDLFSVIEV